MNTAYDHFIKELASAASMANMAEQCGLEVERSQGRRPLALCPYHDDHRPSLYIYEKEGADARDHFHCFACGAHGDIFALVQTLRSVDFWQATTWIAEQYGLSIPKGRHRKGLTKPPRLRGLETALATYQSQTDSEISSHKSIASQRGFSTEFLITSEVYFARGNKVSNSVNPDNDREQVEFLREAGVIRRREPNYLQQETTHLNIQPPLRDLFFGDRLIFAIRNTDGELVGFAGRDLEDKGPKYLFTESFPRRTTLYGLNRVLDLKQA